MSELRKRVKLGEQGSDRDGGGGDAGKQEKITAVCYIAFEISLREHCV